MTQSPWLRVGFVQFDPLFGEVDRNLERVEELIVRVEADLMILPELFATGYLFTSRDEVASMAEEVPGGKTTEFLFRVASRRRLWLVAGLVERSGDHLFNSAVLVSPGGIVHAYRKIHLFDREKLWFSPGDRPFGVYEVEGTKVGMMVCFDWIFPESARILAIRGAELICHPANLVLPYCQEAMITRCLENRVFAVTANRTGTERRDGTELTYTGRSQIVDPQGQILARAGAEEDVQVAEIDPSRSRDKYVTPHNHILKDRRPSLYTPLLEGECRE